MRHSYLHIEEVDEGESKRKMNTIIIKTKISKNYYGLYDNLLRVVQHRRPLRRIQKYRDSKFWLLHWHLIMILFLPAKWTITLSNNFEFFSDFLENRSSFD